MVSDHHVKKALQAVLHPKLKKSLVELGMIRDVTVDGGVVALTLAVKNERSPLTKVWLTQIENVVSTLPEVESVAVEVVTLSQEEVAQIFPQAPLQGTRKVKKFLAVASGKGGVGKTTIAVNVALALCDQGKTVGLLDADVYGPSIPVMLDISEPLHEENNLIVPKRKFQLRVVSLGMTAGENDAFIWRGPLVSKMIHQLLDRVDWGELDYLVIDLPPGTGDPSISIARNLPQCCILMVTTPQEVALADVRRALNLFHKTGQRVIGLVENMSYFVCDHSSQPIEIFGRGGGERLSRETGIPLLGAIPLDLELRAGGDSGVPLLVAAPQSPTVGIFKEIAAKIEQLMA